jgi:hypothetical protein
MKGWKTWTGTILLGLSGAAAALGFHDISESLKIMAGVFLAVGIGHKIEKGK